MYDKIEKIEPLKEGDLVVGALPLPAWNLLREATELKEARAKLVRRLKHETAECAGKCETGIHGTQLTLEEKKLAQHGVVRADYLSALGWEIAYDEHDLWMKGDKEHADYNGYQLRRDGDTIVIVAMKEKSLGQMLQELGAVIDKR